MDNRPAQRCSFGPSRALAWVYAACAVLAGVLAALEDDRAGRLLIALAALVLAVLAFSDLVFAPRLVVAATGVTLRTPSVRTALSWAMVDRLSLDERSRLGLHSRTIEIDSGDMLVVLSRHALGMDPGEAYNLIRAFTPGTVSGQRGGAPDDPDDEQYQNRS